MTKATISEFRDFVKVIGEHIILPDKDGNFWMDVQPDLTEDDIELAKQMGIKFRVKPQ